MELRKWDVSVWMYWCSSEQGSFRAFSTWWWTFGLHNKTEFLEWRSQGKSYTMWIGLSDLGLNVISSACFCEHGDKTSCSTTT